MSNEHDKALLPTLVDDLEAERVRLSNELLRLSEDWAVLDDSTESLQARVDAAAAGQAWVNAIQAQPRRDLSPSILEELSKRAAWLSEEAPRILTDLLAAAEQEESILVRASELRQGFQRVGMSAEHQAILKQRAEQFEQRAKDMERLVEVAVRAGRQSPASDEPTSDELLSVVLQRFRDAQVAENAWTEKSKFEIMAGLNLWLRIVGDQPISRYSADQHRRFKATLQKLPANLNKIPKYRGLTIDQVIALGDPPAAVNTVKKQLTRISAMFVWAVNHEYVAKNPAAGMKIKNSARASEERDEFSTDDLAKLFGSDEYGDGKHREAYMFWTPILALYTGARQNEIAQLQLADFVEIDGIHVVNIDDRGEGKRVKSKAANRAIPLHAELVRLGLLDRVKRLRSQGATRLFPERPGKNPRSIRRVRRCAYSNSNRFVASSTNTG